jgi:Flp pilus assembly protein TadG
MTTPAPRLEAATDIAGGPKVLAADQSGAVVIIAALGMVVLLGFMALATDIGHLVSVKSELQKAADAGALAGARALCPASGPPLPVNWSNGVSAATQTVLENQADGSLLTNPTVQAGYWNLSWAWDASLPLKSQGSSPGFLDVPAVKVTINKADGVNGGPVRMIFGQVLGVNSTPTSAEAVAVLSSLLAVPAGGLLPLAIKDSTVNNYNWSTHPSVRIQDPHQEGDAGWWTTFLQANPSNSYIKDLIAGPGNGGVASPPLKVGDPIYLAPGVRASDFGDTLQYWQNKSVLLPVVPGDEPWGDKDNRQIKGFVTFKITGGSQGGKYLDGYFLIHSASPGDLGKLNNFNINLKLVH